MVNNSTLLLNCDLGESFGSWNMGSDKEVMPWIDMANIACGFHASDPHIMNETVQLAVQHQVKIGAHPGYNDKVGFGRRSLYHTPQQITELVLYQVGALRAFTDLHQTSICYIKPHGALYNDMMKDVTILEAIVKAAATFRVPLMVLASSNNSRYLDIADQYDVPLLFETYADRTFTDSGHLTPRTHANAVLKNESDILHQVKQLVTFGSVHTTSGNSIPVEADTICVHGDNAESVALIQRIHNLITTLGSG